MRNFLTKTQQLHSCVIVAELVEPNLFVTNAVWFSWDYWGVVEIHGGAGKWRRSLLVDQIEKNGRFSFPVLYTCADSWTLVINRVGISLDGLWFIDSFLFKMASKFYHSPNILNFSYCLISVCFALMNHM